MKSLNMFALGVSLFLHMVMVVPWPIGTSVAAAQPANDDFEDATIVTEPLPFTDIVNTTLATTAFDDPDCFGQGPTVWYSFSPSVDMHVEGNTFGSDYDTALSVYVGTRGDLIEIACNDDARGTAQSRVTFDAFAGETYFFMVGAFASGPGGNLLFAVQEAPDLPPLMIDLTVDPVGSFNRAGEATISGAVTCSRPVFVDVFGEARQAVGRFVATSFFNAFVFCEGEAAWEATTRSEIFTFKGGPTKISAFAFAFDVETGEVAQDVEFALVRLRGGGGGPGPKTAQADRAKAAFHGSYPNPFNPQTSLRFSLAEATSARLSIYDVRGRLVRILIDGPLSAGEHNVTFDAGDLPNGIYVSRLEVDGQVLSSRMVLVK